jgi:hypothetical protein
MADRGKAGAILSNSGMHVPSNDLSEWIEEAERLGGVKYFERRLLRTRYRNDGFMPLIRLA